MELIEGKYYRTFINIITKEKYKTFLEFAFKKSNMVSIMIARRAKFDEIKKIKAYEFLNDFISIERTTMRQKQYHTEQLHKTYPDYINIYNGNYIEYTREKVYLPISDDIKQLLFSRKNIFDFQTNDVFIEDPSFYKYSYGHCWFESISHEEDAGIDPEYFKEFKKIYNEKFKKS